MERWVGLTSNKPMTSMTRQGQNLKLLSIIDIHIYIYPHIYIYNLFYLIITLMAKTIL